MSEETTKLPRYLPVRVQRATDYSVKHTDGAWGSITPTLEIQLAFFSLIMPLPTGAKHEVSPDGTIGRLIEDPKEIVLEREMSLSMVFNPLVAVQLIKMLQGLVDQVKESANEQVKASIEAAELASGK